jgi:peptidoglycan-N-acetylglucosamine deacetylase
MSHVISTRTIKHILAPHVPAFARELGIARTLTELSAAAPPVASEPLAGERLAVAITFDDGPHPDGTPRVLEVLAEHGARATFFLVGEQVVQRPELARRILAEGHAVGLHGHRHRPHPTRSAVAVRDDFERGSTAIEDAIGARPRLHRPPYGVYSPASLAIARDRGLAPLLWSKWGKDWRKLTTPDRISARSLRGIAAGDVILLHDADFYSSKRSHCRTVAALPELLRKLKSSELDTVACVYGNPTQDAGGRPEPRLQGGGMPC